jgi:predicted outer membrane repeat protein
MPAATIKYSTTDALQLLNLSQRLCVCDHTSACTYHYLHCYCTLLSSAARGGALAIDGRNQSSAVLASTSFTNNTASQSGGAVYVQSAVLASFFKDCSFLQNSSPAGGGLFVQEVKPMNLTVANCSFESNNSTASSGGGILQSGTELRVQLVPGSNSFTNNSGSCCYAGDDLSGLGGGCLELSAGYGSSWCVLQCVIVELYWCCDCL